MRSYSGSTAIQRNSALAMGFVTVAWLLTVPAVLTTSSFLAVIGVLGALGLVIRATYRNAQPASSFAQSLHDAEHTRSERPRINR